MIFNDNGVNIPFLLIQLIKILAVSINLYSSLHERENKKYYLYAQLESSNAFRERGNLISWMAIGSLCKICFKISFIKKYKQTL